MMPRGGKADTFESYAGRPEMERLKYLIRGLRDRLVAYEKALANGQNETSPEGKALVNCLTEMATNKIFDPRMLKDPAIADKILALCTQPMREHILGFTRNAQSGDVTDAIFRAVFTRNLLTIHADAADALTEVLNNGRVVRTLTLDLKSIPVRGAQSIAAAIAGNGSIEQLHLIFLGATHELGWLSIQAKALSYRAFAAILPGNTSIRELAISNCPYGSEGIKAVALGLRNNQSVTNLYVSSSFLTEADTAAVAAMITETQTLTTLAMPGCEFLPKQTSFAETKRRFSEGIRPFNMIVNALGTNTTITEFSANKSHIKEVQQADVEGYLVRNREMAAGQASSSRSTSSMTPSSASSTSSPSASRWLGGLTRRWRSASISGSSTPSSKTDLLSAGSLENLGSPQKPPITPPPPSRTPGGTPE